MDATAALAGNNGIPIGTQVLDAAGEKLGTVRGGDAYSLLVERGLLFTTTFEVPLETVDRYQDGYLILRATKAQLLGEETEE